MSLRETQQLEAMWLVHRNEHKATLLGHSTFSFHRAQYLLSLELQECLGSALADDWLGKKKKKKKKHTGLVKGPDGHEGDAFFQSFYSTVLPRQH